MIVSWIGADPKEAKTRSTCSGCQTFIEQGELIYFAKQYGNTVKLCEECAESVEIDKEPSIDDREKWLGEL